MREPNVKFSGIFLIVNKLTGKNVESHSSMESAVKAVLILNTHEATHGRKCHYGMEVITQNELYRIQREDK